MSGSPTTFPPAGGTGSLSISVARECAWSAASQAAWLEITSAKDGQGDGAVAYRVIANGDPVTRRGAIVVGDQRVDIGQEAAACQFSLSAPSRPLAATGEQASIDIRTHDGCAWSAATGASWLTVAPASGMGTGVVIITALANASAERSVTVTIASQQVVVLQSAATAPPVPPPPPPPPPPPAPKTVELSGKIDDVAGACPALRFTLKNTLVRTTAATKYSKGTCKDLKDDKEVALQGEVQADRSVTATSIEVKK